MSYEGDGMGYSDAGPSMPTGELDMVPRPGSRAVAKEQRRQRRRRQLAAALVEADNDEIQSRVAFLSRVTAGLEDRAAQLSLLPKYANQSILFQDADALTPAHAYMRPVYVQPLQSMRRLTRTILGMTTDWPDDAPHELEMLEKDAEVTNSLLQLTLTSHDVASPLLDTWDEADVAAVELPALRKVSSMPDMTEAPIDEAASVLDTTQTSPHALPKSKLLLSRIRTSRDVSGEISERADTAEEFSDSASESRESIPADTAPPTEPEPAVPPSNELLGFRARVLQHKPRTARRASRRHSLAVSGWPEESPIDAEGVKTSPVDVPGPMTGEEEHRETFAPILARRETLRNADMSSSHWKKRPGVLRSLFPFERRKPPRSRIASGPMAEQPLIHVEPPSDEREGPHWRNMLEAPSPVVGDVSVRHFSGPQAYRDDDFTGVSLQTPVVPNEAFPELPPPAPKVSYADRAAHYEPAALEPLREHIKQRPYICVPPPLAYPPREKPTSGFFVPHGAFYVDERGVILPRTKKATGMRVDYDYGPVQVPELIGRRVFYPSTALFRNVLVQRDEDREGWGFERYTDAAAYFGTHEADDDDSDDEVPLMDVRIQTREEHLARRRVHRERKRRKRAHLERRRLRALAHRQGKRASVFGIDDVSSGSGAESVSSDDSGFSSDETDPEQPWKDDRRPAGKLYGKSLVGLAGEQHVQRQNQIRFYGQVNLGQDTLPQDRQSGFYNDTRERMERAFGARPRWMNDLEQREGQGVRDQYNALSVGGTPILDDVETMELLREPGVQEVILHPSVQEVEEARLREAEAHDEAAVAAWQDTSSDEEPAKAPPKPSRFQSEKPRWAWKEEDDVPLSQLRPHQTSTDSDDELPLGSRHRQAAIIAENQALIKQLMEENRQVRMSLQMLTSAPYMNTMPGPWPRPHRGSEVFAPMLQMDDDSSLLAPPLPVPSGQDAWGHPQANFQGYPQAYAQGPEGYPQQYAAGPEGYLQQYAAGPEGFPQEYAQDSEGYAEGYAPAPDDNAQAYGLLAPTTYPTLGTQAYAPSPLDPDGHAPADAAYPMHAYTDYAAEEWAHAAHSPNAWLTTSEVAHAPADDMYPRLEEVHDEAPRSGHRPSHSHASSDLMTWDAADVAPSRNVQ